MQQMLNCFPASVFQWSWCGIKQTTEWLIRWLRPLAVWSISGFTRLINSNSFTLIRRAFNSGFTADSYNVNDVKMKAAEECVCVCVYAAVCEAKGGRYALHKDHARNLYKQSSGHSGSPAKHWVSHQPSANHTQTQVHNHTNKHTGGRQSENSMQIYL